MGERVGSAANKRTRLQNFNFVIVASPQYKQMKNHSIFLRNYQPAAMFAEDVLINGKAQPRFERI